MVFACLLKIASSLAARFIFILMFISLIVSLDASLRFLPLLVCRLHAQELELMDLLFYHNGLAAFFINSKVPQLLIYFKSIIHSNLFTLNYYKNNRNLSKSVAE